MNNDKQKRVAEIVEQINNGAYTPKTQLAIQTQENITNGTNEQLLEWYADEMEDRDNPTWRGATTAAKLRVEILNRMK